MTLVYLWLVLQLPLGMALGKFIKGHVHGYG